MKNKELHEFINALQPPTPDMTLFEQRLRRNVLAQPRQRSFLVALGRRLTGTGTSHMKRRKKVMGFGSMAMVLALVLSVGVYSYHFSPKAVAEQTINESMLALNAQAPADLAALQQKFGGDPAEALKEAKLAKDVTVISKADFLAESRDAPGIFATSLGSNFGAVGTNNPSGMTFTSTQIKGGPGTAAMSSGTVSISGSSTTAAVPAAGATPTFTTSAAGSTGAGSGTAPSAQLVKVNADGSTSVMSSAEAGVTTSAPGAPASGTSASGTATFTAATPVMTTGMMSIKDGDLAQPTTISEAAITYLRYTDKKGHVVVLSLDKDGLPIFKTVFMTKAEASNLPGFTATQTKR